MRDRRKRARVMSLPVEFQDRIEHLARARGVRAYDILRKWLAFAAQHARKL